MKKLLSVAAFSFAMCVLGMVSSLLINEAQAVPDCENNKCQISWPIDCGYHVGYNCKIQQNGDCISPLC
jgi:hypothetical protein